MWVIKVLQGKQAGQSFLLKEGKNSLGRAPECDITLNSRGVSKQHAELQVLKDKIKVILRAYIARQLWKNDGYFPVINTIDETFLRTLKILEN